MKSAVLLAAASALVSGVSAAAIERPSKVLQARATTICGQWDSVATGAYTVFQDLWGEAQGTGSQCTTIDSVADDTIAWSTSWSWSGGSNQVKSYANAVATIAKKQISAISKIPTTWNWSYSGSNIVADVSYDLFTSSTASGSNEYEIMIWLAALGGAGPISSTGSTVATPTIGGVSWKLYSGPNGDTTVYSFVAATEQTSFSGDLREFFTYLIANEGFPSTQFLLSVGAGTEPFTGSDAVLTVSAYSLSVTDGTATSAVSSVAASTVAVSTKAVTTASASTKPLTTGSSPFKFGSSGPFVGTNHAVNSSAVFSNFTTGVASSAARTQPTVSAVAVSAARTKPTSSAVSSASTEPTVAVVTSAARTKPTSSAVVSSVSTEPTVAVVTSAARTQPTVSAAVSAARTQPTTSAAVSAARTQATAVSAESDCESASVTVTVTATRPLSTAVATGFAQTNGTLVPHYYQCGGSNWNGSTTCVTPYTCKLWNPYYAQCV
ncbi:xyloglucan-specific endo-beta-1,4-glucanase precursor [Grosmannia clavigera kw1407]|uniref:Xyloglucan-specific endo-beta-1,4-glucanase n=1 Tax=Grosmannia clavigera (strain kw1407 / UAMH 11150) TaxID=655863 RepID=F0X7N1_GROCL|nr:xyloglucan-specific endo-beta-1,4-glucanase precursor [Grosmannia clavigera kw1407]EFX06442.1 xyloglucan-specific endo-beta-1,4-glucanase precursor [Grosmannia clavigera kw1407]